MSTVEQAMWTKVDGHFVEKLSPEDVVLRRCRELSDQHGLPAYNVTANQGMFLQLLIRMHHSRRILEIGTLGGYSTIWMARALQKDDVASKIVTLEISPAHAEVARKSFEDAKLSHVIDLKVGKAAESLQQMIDSKELPFDFIFIDADKPSNPLYLKLCLQLSRPGTVIVADNVVRNGAVADPNSADLSVKGVRDYIDLVAKDERLISTALQTVGSKGYDGFALTIVNSL